MTMHNAPIPVILDTDIGDDIDDTWALAMLLKSPELDTRLIVSDKGDTVYRAKLIGKLLESANRTDIAVGVGVRQEECGGRQSEWVKQYSLSSYPGTLYKDGVQAIIDAVMQSEEPMTLICIGPVPNIAEALRREPRIAAKANFVGMHGDFSPQGDGLPAQEYNVAADPASCRAVFEAAWRSARITPIDTCGRVRLGDERYRRILACDEPLLKTVIDNYRIWAAAMSKETSDPIDADSYSTTLFDTVAVYLAFADDLCRMKRSGVEVTDDGRTVSAPDNPPVDIAIEWNDLERFCDFLVERLVAPVVQPAATPGV